MDTNTHPQLSTLEGEQTYHPPRPSAENRFYSITVGRHPGVYRGTDDWQRQVVAIPGGAVRTFDSLKAAETAYEDAFNAGLVYRVDTVGARRVLTEQDVQTLPGVQAPDTVPFGQKWYSVYVGTQPGLFPGSHHISPLISNISGGRSTRWGSYEQAYDSFMTDLRAGRVIQDTTQFVRTQLG